MDIDCIGLSSENNLGDVYKFFEEKKAVQGNFETGILKEERSIIKNEVIKTLASFPYKSGHIFILGTGITPDINPDKLSYMIDQVRELSIK